MFKDIINNYLTYITYQFVFALLIKQRIKEKFNEKKVHLRQTKPKATEVYFFLYQISIKFYL